MASKNSSTIVIGTKVLTSPFLKGLQAMQSGLASFSSSITNTLGKIGMASIGVQALFTSVKALVGAPLKAAADFESLSTTMEVMLGSADKAKTMMADLSKFGKETPFEMSDIAPAAKQLLAFGFEAKDIIPTLTNLGNISSGINKPIGEMAELFGKLRTSDIFQGEDLNQMLGAGIPITRELAKVMGVAETSIKKMASEGVIKFKHVEAAISNLSNGSGQFSGLMQKQSLTLTGAWSNFSDDAGQALQKFGLKLVDTFHIKDLLGSASGYLTSFCDVAFSVFDNVVLFVTDNMVVWQAWGDSLNAMWSTVGGWISGIWSWIKDNIVVNMSKIKEDVVYGFQAIEFGWKNLGTIAKLGAYSFVLGLVKMGNNVEYFFVDVIPATAKWFGENWKAIFINLYEGTVALFKNLGSNIVNIVKNLGGLIAGTVNWGDVWKPLMSGAQFEIVKALEIPDRVKGKLETQLEQSVREQSTALENAYKDFRKEKDKAIENTAQAAVVAATVATIAAPAQAKKASDYVDKKIAADNNSKNKNELKFGKGNSLGSTDANNSILKVLFGGKDKNFEKDTAKNTAATAAAVKALPAAIAGAMAGAAVGI